MQVQSNPSAKNKTNSKNTKKLADQILLRLKDKYPIIKPQLKHKNALELLVATILSAQCTDARVNMVTPALFAKYKTASDYANANMDDLKKLIRSTGFYNSKAKRLKDLGSVLVEEFNGNVPDNMEKLVTLPGVARKTANVVLHGWFGKNEGVAVDTHVIRLSGRLGLSKEKDPVKIEAGLIKLIEKKELGGCGLRLVLHGRDTCKARKPDCANCGLKDICPSAYKV